MISDPDRGFSFSSFSTLYFRKPFGTEAMCLIQCRKWGLCGWFIFFISNIVDVDIVFDIYIDIDIDILMLWFFIQSRSFIYAIDSAAENGGIR